MTPEELKTSIIHLAMRGKIVEQDSGEGTGSEFFNSIIKEKKQLRVKKNKKIETITEDIIPFDIPESWCWTRFGEIVSFNMGKTPPRAETQWWKKEFPWVSIADMPENGHITTTKEGVSKIALRAKFGDKISKAGTMLMSFKLTIGRVSILDIDAVHNEAIISIYPYCDSGNIFQSYLFHLLPTVTLYGDSKKAIKGNTLNSTSISNLLIPLPPLAEQKRIVAKVEELLPYIDRYEEAWSKLEDLNERFPMDMQKSLLQHAVQGKLVEQRAEEGTAAVLLPGRESSDQAEGTGVKTKTTADITDYEMGFDIPSSWEWVKLGNVCTIARGGSPRPIKVYLTDEDDGVNWIKIGDTEKNSKYIDSTSEKIKPSGVLKSRRIHSGDFLLTNSMSFGRPYISRIDGCIHDGWLVIRQDNEVFYPDFLYYLLSSYFAYMQFCGKASGAVVKNLNIEKVANSVFPLPPLAEQKRIVAKLEQLLPLCDKLK